METIRNNYAEAVRNQIRDESEGSSTIKKNLTTLGEIVGARIAEKYFLTEKTITTPMGEVYTGPLLCLDRVVIVSTRDDFMFFANGLAKTFKNVSTGFIDFGGIRGHEALSSPLRSITLPDIENVDTVIIAKSVLATGCTAITLARKALEKYWPKRLIIASVFYSIQGTNEVQKECKIDDIFVIGEPEELRQDGMLIPGFGDLDKRISDE